MIQIRPGQSRISIRKTEGVWVLGVREPAREGLANRGVLEALSDFLEVPVSCLTIIRGEGSRVKMVEVVGLSPTEGLLRLEKSLVF